MRITLYSQRRDDLLEVFKDGHVLVVNGETFDFSTMADGDTLPGAAIASGWFAGDVDKDEGELTLTLVRPLPSNFSQEQAFPVDLIDVPDGMVAFPRPLPLPAPEAQAELTQEAPV